jgi:hypothetical protein
MPTDATDELSDLGRALDVARENPNQANYFYDTFLNWDLVIPVQKDASNAGTWRRLALDDKFFPLFISQGEIRIVPAFDTLERLKTWAASRELDYIQVRAHLFLQMLGSKVALSLNPGSDSNYVFGPSLIEQLVGNMKLVRPT